MFHKCPVCNLIYSDDVERCFKCNRRLVIYTDEQFEIDKYYNKPQVFANIPKCPTCGSTNIKKISDLSRGAHALAFGLFSNTARSQFECLDCHYKW